MAPVSTSSDLRAQAQQSTRGNKKRHKPKIDKSKKIDQKVANNRTSPYTSRRRPDNDRDNSDNPCSSVSGSGQGSIDYDSQSAAIAAQAIDHCATGEDTPPPSLHRKKFRKIEDNRDDNVDKVKRQKHHHDASPSIEIRRENNTDPIAVSPTITQSLHSNEVTKEVLYPEASLMGIPLHIREMIWDLCAKDHLQETWEENPECDTELLQKFPKYAAQKNEVQLLRVSKQVCGEYIMSLYKTVSVVISGSDFAFDGFGKTEEYLDPQGRSWKTNGRRDYKHRLDLINLKLSLVKGKSLSGPDFAMTTMFRYMKHLRLTLDRKQYEDDWIFPDAAGNQQFSWGEHGRLFKVEAKKEVSYTAAAMTHDRVQGRVAINSILMAKLSSFLRNQRPKLESAFIDCGAGLKKSEWQNSEFTAKAGFLPAGIDREGHLNESVASVKEWLDFEPHIGPGLVKELKHISESDQRIQYVTMDSDGQDFRENQIDYTDLFLELQKEALSPAGTTLRRADEDYDLGALSHDFDQLLRMFLPLPLSDCDVAYRMNKIFEFDSWVYDDVYIINQLGQERQGSLSLTVISHFYQKAYLEIRKRTLQILDAHKNVLRHTRRNVSRRLLPWFNSFTSGEVDDYRPQRGEKLTDPEAYDIVSAIRELRTELFRSDGWKIKYDRMLAELEKRSQRIEKALDNFGHKYNWLFHLAVPGDKNDAPVTSNEPSPLENEPNYTLDCRIASDNLINHLQNDRTLALDEEIRSAAARGDSLIAWIRLQVMKHSPYFRPGSLKPRDKSVFIHVKPWNVLPDKRSQDEINADLFAKASLVMAKHGLEEKSKMEGEVLAKGKDGNVSKGEVEVALNFGENERLSPLQRLAEALVEAQRQIEEEQQRHSILREQHRVELEEWVNGKEVVDKSGEKMTMSA